MNKIEEIYFISDRIPYPPDLDGNNINIFNIVKEFSLLEDYKITFILHATDYEQKYFDIFKNYVDDIVVKKPLNQYSFFFSLPFKNKVNIQGALFFCNYDTGIFTSLYSATKKILYTADSPTFHHKKNSSLLSKVLYFKHLVQENYLFSRFDDVVFVSDDDLNYSSSRIKGKGHTIPIGYTNALIHSDYKVKKIFDFAFSGNFSYRPNSLAVETFVENNIPELLKQLPDATFYFVGRNPTKKMYQLASLYKNNIYISGEVESVEKELLKARIYFSTLSKGSGMKNKMLQAMICRLPIVCTPESWSGFSLDIPAGVWIKEINSELNNKLISLYNKSQLKIDKYGELNFQYYSDNYTWLGIVNNYYKQLLKTNDD